MHRQTERRMAASRTGHSVDTVGCREECGISCRSTSYVSELTIVKMFFLSVRVGGSRGIPWGRMGGTILVFGPDGATGGAESTEISGLLCARHVRRADMLTAGGGVWSRKTAFFIFTPRLRPGQLKADNTAPGPFYYFRRTVASPNLNRTTQTIMKNPLGAQLLLTTSQKKNKIRLVVT